MGEGGSLSIIDLNWLPGILSVAGPVLMGIKLAGML